MSKKKNKKKTGKYVGKSMDDLRALLGERGIEGRGMAKTLQEMINLLEGHDNAANRMNPVMDEETLDTTTEVAREHEEIIEPEAIAQAEFEQVLEREKPEFKVERREPPPVSTEPAPPPPGDALKHGVKYRVLEPMRIGAGGYALLMGKDAVVATNTHEHLREWVNQGLKVKEVSKVSFGVDQAGTQPTVTFEDD